MHNNSTLIRSVRIPHAIVLLGMGSLSIAGHQIHVAIPTMSLLDSGITYSQQEGSISHKDWIHTTLGNQDDLMRTLTATFGIGTQIDIRLYLPSHTSLIGSTSDLLNP